MAAQIVARGEHAHLTDAVAQEAGDSIMMKLGEAAGRLARTDASPPEALRWADAIANRNWVIHQYDNLDRAVTWETLSRSIPSWGLALAPAFEAAQAIVSKP